MPETSTTPADNPTNNDAGADSTTVTDPKAGTDNQPADDKDKSDNLEASKSDDKPAADGDNKPPASDDKKDDAPTTPKLDDDLDDWIEKRGLAKPTDDKQKEAYQDLRNSQRDYTREQQAKREAADAKALGDEIHNSKPEQKTDDDDEKDPIEKRQDDLDAKFKSERTARLQSEFYTDNKVTEEQGKAILEIFKEETTRGETLDEKLTDHEYWSDPKRLSTLLSLAKARLASSVDPAIAAEKAAQEERERIAKESESKSPNRNATNTQTSDKTEEQAALERWRARYNK